MNLIPLHKKYYCILCLLLFVLIAFILINYFRGKTDVISINSSEVNKVHDIGEIGSVYAGETLEKRYVLFNDSDIPLYVTAKTSCGCNTVNLESDKISPGNKTILTFSFDSKDSSRRTDKAKAITIILTATNNASKTTPEQSRYKTTIVGTVGVKKSIEITNNVSFGRPKLMDGRQIIRHVNMKNFSGKPADISISPLLTDVFKLPEQIQFTLQEDMNAKIPLILTDKWEGDGKVQEDLRFKIKIGDSEWIDKTIIGVYPRLKYHTEPTAIILGKVNKYSGKIKKNIKVVDDNSMPVTNFLSVKYNKEIMDIRTIENGTLEIEINCSKWTMTNREDIIIRLASDSQDEIITVPVIAYWEQK